MAMRKQIKGDKTMTYDYIPKVPDYYTAPDYSEPDGEAEYFADQEEKRKRENEDCSQDR